MRKKTTTIQDYLSLGYVYLIVLGMSYDVIFYKFLGVNVLSYSTILDVLISPINFISYHFIFFIIFCIFVFLAYFVFEFLLPKVHLKNRDKEWYKKANNVEKLDKWYIEKQKTGSVPAVLFGVLLLFTGIGTGKGYAIHSRINEKDLKQTHLIEFNSGESKKVCIIGQNSSFIFYILDDETQISISPIDSNVYRIKKLKSEGKEQDKTALKKHKK